MVGAARRSALLGRPPHRCSSDMPAARRRSTGPSDSPPTCSPRRARSAGGRRAPHRPSALPQARGPRPHRCAQDQQRARPGAPHAAARQESRDRRDGRRPARRRDGDCVCAARPAVRRVHGRRGHPPPGSQRAPDGGARGRGPAGAQRQRDAQGRDQRGHARLGHQRGDDALRDRLGDGPAPVPDARARPAAHDRRRGGRPDAGDRGPPAGPRARVRRRRLERDRPARPLHRRAGGPTRDHRSGRRGDRHGSARGSGGRRNRRHPARRTLAHAPGPRRPGRRGALHLGRARLPGRGPADRSARDERPGRIDDGDRPRGDRRASACRAHRGHPARARDEPRVRRPAATPGGHARVPARSRASRSSSSASRAVATRTWPPSKPAR